MYKPTHKYVERYLLKEHQKESKQQGGRFF